jgi:hypothetical protein
MWYNEVMNNKINYPKKHSEAEIEALLWYFLRKKKVDARLQVTGYNPVTGKKSCKMDLVVFKDQVPICIVECKSWSDSYRLNQKYRRSNNTKQLMKYKSLYEIPVLVCGHMRQVTSIQNEILELYKVAIQPVSEKS